MKDNHTELYPNEQVGTAVGDYAFKHSTKLPQHIIDHHAWGVETQEIANYMISPLQAQFHIWFAKMLGVKRILEIGTFIGFSTMGWSSAIGPDGHVTTLEFSPEYAAIAEESFAKHDIKNVEVIVGDARESIKNLPGSLTEPYDLIFIDADKTSYPTYLSLVLGLSRADSTGTRLLRAGGLIVADNVLRRGLVADSSPANPWAANRGWPGIPEELMALKEFNRAMVDDPRVDVFLLPMFDGLGMGKLLD